MRILQNKYLKLFIGFLIIVWSASEFFKGHIGNGIALIFLSVIPFALFFRNEFILLAFFRLRKQDFAGTQKWLNKIKDPKTALIQKQQGYYYYLNGIISSQTNLTLAEKFFRKALQLGLTMDYDIAMAKMSLAGIMMQKRRKREAQILLQEAKKLDKHNMLVEQIKLMQQQLKRI